VAAIDHFVRHARAPWATFPRLAHPLLSHLILPLLETLMGDGCLEQVAAGYMLTEKGLAYVRQREPRLLL
jgi:hypothetical protein